MTFRIERDPSPQKTTIRLIGRIRREHLGELKAQMRAGGPSVALDLDEVSLVDLDVIRFLGLCQVGGVPILHCSPYIRDWIAEELRSSNRRVESGRCRRRANYWRNVWR